METCTWGRNLFNKLSSGIFNSQFQKEIANFCQSSVKTRGIKSVSLEYSCDEEHSEEFNKGKVLKCPLLLAEPPRNTLDPIDVNRPIM